MTPTRLLRASLAVLLPGCAAAPPAATQANAVIQPIAPDSVALRELAEVAPSVKRDLRYATDHNFTGRPIPGYGIPVLLLRREVARALERVEDDLRQRGLGLKVFDGYRPVRATEAMVAWAKRVGRVDLLDDGYIARRSRHNQGVAVDLTLIDAASGKQLDMGTAFDTFDSTAHTANATGAIAERRALLVAAMAREGFVNYANEWWHFSHAVSSPQPFDLPLSRWRRSGSP